jgi:uncharacterized protein (UPF0262 family)
MQHEATKNISLSVLIRRLVQASRKDGKVDTLKDIQIFSISGFLHILHDLLVYCADKCGHKSPLKIFDVKIGRPGLHRLVLRSLVDSRTTLFRVCEAQNSGVKGK